MGELQVVLKVGVESDYAVSMDQRRPKRALGAFVVPRENPKYTHHSTADEFFDRPAIPGDLLAHRRKEAGDQRAHRLGIQLLGQPGRAYEVGEQHGDDTAFSRAGSLQESPALHAKLRLRRVAWAAPWGA